MLNYYEIMMEQERKIFDARSIAIQCRKNLADILIQHIDSDFKTHAIQVNGIIYTYHSSSCPGWEYRDFIELKVIFLPITQKGFVKKDRERIESMKYQKRDLNKYWHKDYRKKKTHLVFNYEFDFKNISDGLKIIKPTANDI